MALVSCGARAGAGDERGALQQPRAAREGCVLWRWGQHESRWGQPGGQRGAKLGLVRSRGHSRSPGSRPAEMPEADGQPEPQPHARSRGVQAGPAPWPPATDPVTAPVLAAERGAPACPCLTPGSCRLPQRRALLAQQLGRPPAVSQGLPAILGLFAQCLLPRLPEHWCRAARQLLHASAGRGTGQGPGAAGRMEAAALCPGAARPAVVPVTHPVPAVLPDQPRPVVVPGSAAADLHEADGRPRPCAGLRCCMQDECAT